MSSRSQRTSKRRRGLPADVDENKEQVPSRGQGTTSRHRHAGRRAADQNDDEDQEGYGEEQSIQEQAPDQMPAKGQGRSKSKKARADEGTSSQAQPDPLMHLQQLLAANAANVQNPQPPTAVQPQQQAGDPVKAVLPRFMQIAVGVSEATAQEVLAETLAQNPKLKEDTLMWLEEAQIRLACVHEVDAETEALRDAMAHSLAEAEMVRKQQEEEERRQGPVAALRKKFSNSKILQELQKVVCLSLLLQSPSKQSLTKLLTLERNCLKWYAGHGTILYFNTLANQYHDSYHKAVKNAMQSHGITPTSSTATPQLASTSTAACSHQQHKSADPTNPAPLLCCLPPYVPCRVCGASSTSEDNPTASHPTGQGNDSRPATEASTVDNHANGNGNGPGNEGSAREQNADTFLQQFPQLAAVFKKLDKELVEKEAYIQEQVSKMPEEQLTTSSNAACTRAYVPPIFRLPENHQVQLEVFECFSDDD